MFGRGNCGEAFMADRINRAIRVDSVGESSVCGHCGLLSVDQSYLFYSPERYTAQSPQGNSQPLTEVGYPAQSS